MPVFHPCCRLFMLCLLAINLCSACHAQGSAIDSDSLCFVSANWQEERQENIRFLQHQFLSDSLFGHPQYIFWMEIPPTEIYRLHYAYDPQLSPTSVQAQRHQALAAVNGSFFDIDQGFPICYLRIDSVEVGENTPGKTDSINRKYYQYATLSLADSALNFIIPDSNRCHEASLPGRNLMTAGPMLIYHDSVIPQRDDRTFVTHRHNRTAVGLRADGSAIILVADGRFRNQAAGLSLNELCNLMRWLGCRDAINLDGGGSSTFYVHPQDNEPQSAVRNYPSDNRRFDHEGERDVSSILYIEALRTEHEVPIEQKQSE
ncbi:MAG: phosphodiester glycosidase family protein [Bacteroidales bacterium]|nr:phosphodiester glycosidase family protein [Bacteroidales bacterium]